MKIIYTNIQHMTTQDGPGVRTTVFLKGCNLHCPWCSNPENLLGEAQYYFQEDKCYFRKHGSCYDDKCPMRSSLDLPPPDADLKCLYGALGQYGKFIEPCELAELLLTDYEYWQGTGGVTFSGGEALLQMPSLLDTITVLKEKNVHIAVETALHVSEKHVLLAIENVDFFYVDVKILASEAASCILGGDVNRFYANMENLANSDREVCFRVPCNDEFVLQSNNVRLLLDFFMQYSKYPIEIFATHSLGEAKYKSLNKKIRTFSSTRMQDFYRQLKNQGNIVKIIKL